MPLRTWLGTLVCDLGRMNTDGRTSRSGLRNMQSESGFRGYGSNEAVGRNTVSGYFSVV